MPTLSVGTINRQRGVTLIEMLIVITLIAIVAGISYPSVSSGLDSLRLRSASDAMVSFLNVALDRADRRQQAVELWISPADNALLAKSVDGGFTRRFDIPQPIRIVSVQPALEADADSQHQARRFMVYPGGTVPRIGIEIINPQGRKRMVSVDPVTGVPRSELEP